jgi:hypothetical protein
MLPAGSHRNGNWHILCEFPPPTLIEQTIHPISFCVQIRFVLHNFRPNRYSLVDRTDWPDDDPVGNGNLRAAIIGDKFSVPQTIVVHRNSDATGGGKMPILSNLHHKNSASDYGSLIMGQTTSSSDVFGVSVNGTDGKEQRIEQKHNSSR